MVLIILALPPKVVSHCVAVRHDFLAHARPKELLAWHAVLHRVLLRDVLTAIRALLVLGAGD